jgi:chemotaxis protein methyltransferase CheR
LSPTDLEFVCALARVRSGQVLAGERGFFVETRLSPLARREGAASVSDLIARVKSGGDERLMRTVVEALLIQETGFFRDRIAFRTLLDDALPALAREPGPVRVWSAGCASGQEAYSLAMMTDAAPTPVGLDIFATDLSASALEKAESGVYTHFEVQRGLPIRSLLRYFEPSGDSWRISAAMRSQVRWRRLNLVDDFSGGEPFHIILCRHVLETFDQRMRAVVLDRLTASLTPNGWLALSPDEAPPPGFSAVGPGLFRRKAVMSVAA